MATPEVKNRPKTQIGLTRKVEAGLRKTKATDLSNKDQAGLSKTRGSEPISFADYYRSTPLGVGPGNG